MKKDDKKTVTTKKYAHDSLLAIENERLNFFQVYKKHNNLKGIVAFATIIAILIAFIIIPNVLTDNKTLSSGISLIVAVIGLGGGFGYSVFAKRKVEGKMKNYFGKYYSNSNDFVFDEKGYSKVALQTPDKITVEQFKECDLYKDVVEAGSRGLTEFEYNGIAMSVADCAGNVKTAKRLSPVFVGKYLIAPSTYLEEESIVIYWKGNERSLPPTNLEGLAKVLEDEKYDIYSNNKNWSKTINSTIKKIIEGFKTNNNLIDMAVSIRKGKVYVLMGYDDPLMILPLLDEFNSHYMELYKIDLLQVCKFVEALNK